ncbi:MAG TPA: sulfatase [Pirellulales bacterium]|nr:sulfatase [Pirellulales bacterium]
MRAVGLFAVFTLGKLIVLWGRDLASSVWVPLAFLWQDLALVLVFAVFDRLSRRAALNWGIYAALVAYMALNVPVARAVSSWLTWPMLRAVGGTLTDSIFHYLTCQNMAAVAALAATAVGVPRLLVRVTSRNWGRVGLAALPLVALPLVALGPLATARVETIGLDRNVVAALVLSAFPRIAPADAEGDWRESPLGPVQAEDLSSLRGVAAGRNVLLVVLESAAAGYLRPYGAAEDPMPNLTRLADDGLLAEHAYVVYPESIKGLHAMLSSAWPAFDTAPEVYARSPHPALGTLLAQAGYRTALFHSGRFMYLGMDSVVRDRGYQTLADAGDIGGNHESSFGVDEPATVERIFQWIDAGPKQQPFFVTYMPVAGHHPYDTPEPGPFLEHEEIDRYRNALDYADQALGSLLVGLRVRGLSERTLIVVVGDHGQAFGQHEGNYGHTLFLYEENVRVPLVFAAPGAIRRPRRIGRIASHVDLAPTVLDLLGLVAPQDYQGVSLLTGRAGMALFFTDYSLGFLGLRDGRWKFIYQLEDGRSKLFDLVDDPGETVNLADRQLERVAAYREHLLRWSASNVGQVSMGP